MNIKIANHKIVIKIACVKADEVSWETSVVISSPFKTHSNSEWANTQVIWGSKNKKQGNIAQAFSGSLVYLKFE